MASHLDITTDDGAEVTTKRTARQRYDDFRKWMKSASFSIYMNVLLSQWGDWMWQFAVGIYLVKLADGDLLLAAIFGFTSGGFVFLLGGVIGEWVDNNGRLKVVRIALVVQNLSVSLSCVCFCVRISVDVVSSHRVWRHLTEAGIIAMAVLAQLASVAYRVSIEKDWLVIIAAGSSSALANLNAVCRTLDLVCKVLSPTVVGVIMGYTPTWVSAVVIAVWNVMSMFFEYYFLSRVYRLVPELSVKHTRNEGQEMEEKMTSVVSPEKHVIVIEDTANVEEEKSSDAEADALNTESDAIRNSDKSDEATASEAQQDALTPKQPSDADAALETDMLKKKPGVNGETDDAGMRNDRKEKKSFCRKLFEPILVVGYGWRVYARQKVVYACVALGFLYMTVLGFDSVTLGYIYSCGINEFIVGVCMGLAGLTGVIGALLFTRLRRRIGLERTGLFAFNAEITCLTLAVASVWLPGSLFDPHFASRTPVTYCNTTELVTEMVNTPFGTTDASSSSLSTSDLIATTSAVSCVEKKAAQLLNISIVVLLVGIITSRVGLWMADLVVTQLMQESVVETERGVVGGVQNSLNTLMDMLKFALVMAIPQIELFGIHIILSFIFIVGAGMFFAYHSWKVRGHLFHFSKLKKMCCCRPKSRRNFAG